jgi:hypothetical protein
MKKLAVIDTITMLPEEFSIDELIERLLVLDKIDKGRLQIKEGKINTEAQLNTKLAKWLS